VQTCATRRAEEALPNFLVDVENLKEGLVSLGTFGCDFKLAGVVSLNDVMCH